MTDSKQLSVVGFAGSLRSKSFNAVLLRAAIKNAPETVRITELDISDIPFYSGDVESEGDPSSVKRIKDAVRGADGFLVVTPEYNSGVPAVTKNVMDWLSRSSGRTETAIRKTPTAIAAASPGGRGALGSREELARSTGAISDYLFSETFGLAGVGQKVDDENNLTDQDSIAELKEWLGRFERHIVESNN